MRILLKSIVVVALSGGFVGQATAQSPDSGREARAVVDEFLKRTHAERWTEAAALLDLTAYERYFRNRVNMARADLPRPAMTAEEYMEHDSTMPRAVAEWHVARSREFAKRTPFGDFSREFAGITSFRALQALTPAEAAARSLEAQDPRTAMRRAMAQSKCPVQAADSVMLFGRVEQQTIGVAVIDDTTAYVLVTSVLQDAAREPWRSRSPDLIEVRRSVLGWRIASPPRGAGGYSYAVGMSCESR